ncbi:hypothetical protein LguiA_007512 [Lonicera macranthoides]
MATVAIWIRLLGLNLLHLLSPQTLSRIVSLIGWQTTTNTDMMTARSQEEQAGLCQNSCGNRRSKMRKKLSREFYSNIFSRVKAAKEDLTQQHAIVDAQVRQNENDLLSAYVELCEAKEDFY